MYEAKYDAALKTAVRLTEYELELDTKKVYSVLALASYYNSNFKICSQAFVKLENIENNSEDDKEVYEDMASNIFRVNSPTDSKFLNELLLLLLYKKGSKNVLVQVKHVKAWLQNMILTVMCVGLISNLVLLLDVQF